MKGMEKVIEEIAAQRERERTNPVGTARNPFVFYVPRWLMNHWVTASRKSEQEIIDHSLAAHVKIEVIEPRPEGY